jgi:large subunit ribosomal protein L22
MGKDRTPTRFSDNQAGATAKYVRVPPRKARLVMDAVRGKYVADALAILKFVPNFAARAIEKVIESAVANAENSRPVSESTGRPLSPLVRENLKLVSGRIDEGPRIKRLQPRAQGRAFRILKRMCHISVIVEETAPKPRPVRKPAAKRAAAAGRQAPARPAVVRAAKPKEAEAPQTEEQAQVVAPVEETVAAAEPVVAEAVAAEEAGALEETVSMPQGVDDEPAGEPMPPTEEEPAPPSDESEKKD